MAKKAEQKTNQKYWLMKSEPGNYSIGDLAKDRKTLWTGVRNYQARNFMMTGMSKGDEVLFYHSNAEPSGVAGRARVTRVGVADPTALDSKGMYYDPKASDDHPIWFCAEIEFVEEFPVLIPLTDLRANKALANMPLLQKGSRLSVQPVAAAEFAAVEKMALATVAEAAKGKGRNKNQRQLIAKKTSSAPHKKMSKAK